MPTAKSSSRSSRRNDRHRGGLTGEVHPPLPDDLIAVARIVGTHGLRGEVRVYPFNPDTETLTDGATVSLRRDDTSESRRIVAARPHKKMFLVTFSDCASIEAAEPWVGAEVCVPRSALPSPEPNQIYHFDLLGMDVVTLSGDPIGSVTEVLDTGSAAVCVVRDDRNEYLIPLIEAVVREIDQAGRRLVIDPIPGLLEP